MIINSINIKFLFFLCGLASLGACQRNPDPLSTHQLYVFGTVTEISVWHENDASTQAAVGEISDTFNQLHHQWHAWKPGRLQSINHLLQTGQTAQLNPTEAQFIQQVMALSRQSNHQFNPTIGALVNLWGFHSDEYPLTTPPPAAADINTLADQHITVDDLSLEGLILSSDQTNMWLDFGGIAKGYAVDRAIEILRQHGVQNAIVNAGGDLRGIGSKGEQAWQVAIQSPVDWGFIASIQLSDNEAAFTSGNYQRYKEFDGQRYAHIIDPTTGLPVKSIVSATVISDRGIIADAAATAMVVAGEDWPQVAKKMGINQVLIIDEKLQCFGTATMIARLRNHTIECQTVE